jgi:outer membrane protein assembly factor BamA
VNGVPRFQRFWLGGETYGPRVFQTRDISPLRYVRLNAAGEVIEATSDPSGRPTRDFDLNGDGVINRGDLVALGGDRYWLAMAEYTIPFQSPVEVALFVDAGNTLYEDTGWGLADYRASAGVELRFFLPVFPVPLRLIYGWPLRKLPEDQTSAFTFSIGRSF